MYIRSSKNRVPRKSRRIVAEEEVQNGSVSVAPEATELVFETEDVAELLAEVTGNDVEVVADENEITFTVGDTDYTVESEGGEEVLEASTKVVRGKAIRANTQRAKRNPVSASRSTNRTPNGRPMRRIPR